MRLNKEHNFYGRTTGKKNSRFVVWSIVGICAGTCIGLLGLYGVGYYTFNALGTEVTKVAEEPKTDLDEVTTIDAVLPLETDESEKEPEGVSKEEVEMPETVETSQETEPIADEETAEEISEIVEEIINQEVDEEAVEVAEEVITIEATASRTTTKHGYVLEEVVDDGYKYYVDQGLKFVCPIPAGFEVISDSDPYTRLAVRSADGCIVMKIGASSNPNQLTAEQSMNQYVDNAKSQDAGVDYARSGGNWYAVSKTTATQYVYRKCFVDSTQRWVEFQKSGKTTEPFGDYVSYIQGHFGKTAYQTFGQN
jgi:hypothetical protein